VAVDFFLRPAVDCARGAKVMMFEFTIERSAAPEHQAVGIRCRMYQSSGTVDLNSVNAVREHCVRLMIIPGVYEVRIRNAQPDHDWLAAEHVDTRAPDQVPSAAKTVKRKATL
jgi:hypothetical protein